MKNKPIPVWLIAIYLGVVTIGGALGNVAYLAGFLDEVVIERSLMDWVLSISGVTVAGILCVCLFRLKKIAFHVCVVWLALGSIGVIRNASEASLGLMVFNIFILVSVTGYVFYLYREKQLI